MGGEFNVDRRVEERFLAPVHLRHKSGYVLQIALGGDGLLKILRAAALHAVFVGGVCDNLFLLIRGDMPGINMQGHAVFFSEIPKDGLLIGRGWIFPKRPNTAEGIAADEMVGVKFDNRW